MIKYDSGNHLLAFNFEDQTAMRYDSAGHALLAVNFSDGTTIKYDGVAHALSMLGSAATSVTSTRQPESRLQCDNFIRVRSSRSDGQPCCLALP